MGTRRKKVLVHFMQDENVQNYILPSEPFKGRSRIAAHAGENNVTGAGTNNIPSGRESELHSTLFCEDTDVTGLEVLGIQKQPRFSCDSMLASVKMASSLNHSPKTPASAKKALKRTPKYDSSTPKPESPLGLKKIKREETDVNDEPPKTPYNTRRKLKTDLARCTQAMELGGSSDSDFSPSDSEDSSDAGQDEIESEEHQKPVVTLRSTPASSRQISLRRNVRNEDNPDYIIDADEYFRLSKSKTRTSNHTLSRLKTPKLPADKLQTLLKGITQTHKDSITELREEHKQMFEKWTFALSEGYGVMVYGFGSKRALLNTFHSEAVKFPVLVCNGYFPSLTINQMVDSIVDGILGVRENRSHADGIELVERSFHAGSKKRMALVVHNIDGPCLRSIKSQDVLARIARLPNVWFLASIDHVKGPAVWDQTILRQMNLTFWDATSMLPYSEETSFESSLLVQRTGTLMLSSLSNVFQSLTNNAQGIFMVIVDYQLSRGTNKRLYSGIQFKDLYRFCRDKMLVSSDQTLRAQLTEFLDHKLIVSKRGQGGSEMLTIPLENSLLETFLEQRGKNNA